MNQDVPVGVKRQTLQQKIQGYSQAYYSHKVDAQIAQDIGGMEQVVTQARENMAKMQKFIDALEKLLAELK